MTRKGNHVLYEYSQEHADPKIDTIDRRGRRFSQSYIRRILYGNTPDDLAPTKRAGQVRVGTDHVDPTLTRERHYVFELLFEYDPVSEISLPHRSVGSEDDPAVWPARPDPFSSFRAGFEIRTLRRCHSVLMLHHFNEGELTGAPIVKSTDLAYQVDPNTKLSFLQSATITGYRRDPHRPEEYLRRSMPPVSFEYSQFAPDQQRYQSVNADGGDLPPTPLTDPELALLDVFGNGTQDIVQGSDTGLCLLGKYRWRAAFTSAISTGRSPLPFPFHNRT